VQDARAIVTGHSRGLGAAIADQLLSRDIAVLGIARHQRPDLADRYGDRLQEVELDLSDVGAVTLWLETRTFAGFLAGSHTALLINNAGLLQPIGPLQSQDVGDVGRAGSVNVTAALMLSATFAQATSPKVDRRILHVSSAAGHKAYRGWAIYCASKAALDHHARAVALDETPGLRICSVAPGLIDTDMQTEIRASSLDDFPDRPRFDEFKERGQLRPPREVAARLVDYLLSARFGSKPVVDLHDEAPRP
jgi:benzil reductase ((S)-benzoin forming)